MKAKKKRTTKRPPRDLKAEIDELLTKEPLEQKIAGIIDQRFAAFERWQSASERQMSQRMKEILLRMKESDEIICQATKVLSVLSTNTAKARDEAREETTRIKARLDLDREERRMSHDFVDARLRDLVALIEKRKVSMRDVVDLVDAARGSE